MGKHTKSSPPPPLHHKKYNIKKKKANDERSKRQVISDFYTQGSKSTASISFVFSAGVTVGTKAAATGATDP